ncbi:MAG: hypothetical protein ACI4VM_08275 [Anaerovoracaceae bacterium]
MIAPMITTAQNSINTLDPGFAAGIMGHWKTFASGMFPGADLVHLNPREQEPAAEGPALHVQVILRMMMQYLTDLELNFQPTAIRGGDLFVLRSALENNMKMLAVADQRQYAELRKIFVLLENLENTYRLQTQLEAEEKKNLALLQEQQGSRKAESRTAKTGKKKNRKQKKPVAADQEAVQQHQNRAAQIQAQILHTRTELQQQSQELRRSIFTKMEEKTVSSISNQSHSFSSSLLSVQRQQNGEARQFAGEVQRLSQTQQHTLFSMITGSGFLTYVENRKEFARDPAAVEKIAELLQSAGKQAAEDAFRLTKTEQTGSTGPAGEQAASSFALQQDAAGAQKSSPAQAGAAVPAQSETELVQKLIRQIFRTEDTQLKTIVKRMIQSARQEQTGQKEQAVSGFGDEAALFYNVYESGGLSTEPALPAADGREAAFAAVQAQGMLPVFRDRLVPAALWQTFYNEKLQNSLTQSALFPFYGQTVYEDHPVFSEGGAAYVSREVHKLFRGDMRMTAALQRAFYTENQQTQWMQNRLFYGLHQIIFENHPDFTTEHTSYSDKGTLQLLRNSSVQQETQAFFSRTRELLQEIRQTVIPGQAGGQVLIRQVSRLLEEIHTQAQGRELLLTEIRNTSRSEELVTRLAEVKQLIREHTTQQQRDVYGIEVLLQKTEQLLFGSGSAGRNPASRQAFGTRIHEKVQRMARAMQEPAGQTAPGEQDGRLSLSDAAGTADADIRTITGSITEVPVVSVSMEHRKSTQEAETGLPASEKSPGQEQKTEPVMSVPSQDFIRTGEKPSGFHSPAPEKESGDVQSTVLEHRNTEHTQTLIRETAQAVLREREASAEAAVSPVSGSAQERRSLREDSSGKRDSPDISESRMQLLEKNIYNVNSSFVNQIAGGKTEFRVLSGGDTLIHVNRGDNAITVIPAEGRARVTVRDISGLQLYESGSESPSYPGRPVSVTLRNPQEHKEAAAAAPLRETEKVVERELKDVRIITEKEQKNSSSQLQMVKELERKVSEQETRIRELSERQSREVQKLSGAELQRITKEIVGNLNREMRLERQRRGFD